jgi:hypothetical protein
MKYDHEKHQKLQKIFRLVSHLSLEVSVFKIHGEDPYFKTKNQAKTLTKILRARPRLLTKVSRPRARLSQTVLE